jgi:hypothetical protein
MTEHERRIRYGRCPTCGTVRDMRRFFKTSNHGRAYPFLEVYCPRCRFDELVTSGLLAS